MSLVATPQRVYDMAVCRKATLLWASTGRINGKVTFSVGGRNALNSGANPSSVTLSGSGRRPAWYATRQANSAPLILRADSNPTCLHGKFQQPLLLFVHDSVLVAHSRAAAQVLATSQLQTVTVALYLLRHEVVTNRETDRVLKSTPKRCGRQEEQTCRAITLSKRRSGPSRADRG